MHVEIGSILLHPRNISTSLIDLISGWKIIFQVNEPKKKAVVAILVSNKIDFKQRVNKRDTERHYITH